MKDIFKIMAVAGAGAMMLTGCGNDNEWTVKGNIPAAEGDGYVVEAYSNGYWYLLDSLTTSKSGDFSYSHVAMGYPDVYRLRNGVTSVYFPIDSIETVTLTSKGDTFGADTELSGSDAATAMMQADSIINKALATMGDAARTDETVKRELSTLVLADPSSIVAYYVINRKIGGRPLYDPSDKNDLKIIGAVANAFNTMRPADPRTAYLKQLYIENRRATMPRDSVRTVVANEISAPEINLYDNNGRQQSLTALASTGKVIILNFTIYAANESPAFNVLLNSLYEKYHSAGLEIYQVALDDNEYAWKQTADNLPWITVINDAADSDQVLRSYNVGSIPSLFILDRSGSVVERVTELDNLESLVKKYL